MALFGSSGTKGAAQWAHEAVAAEIAAEGETFAPEVESFRRENARYVRRMWMLDRIAHLSLRLRGLARLRRVRDPARDEWI